MNKGKKNSDTRWLLIFYMKMLKSKVALNPSVLFAREKGIIFKICNQSSSSSRLLSDEHDDEYVDEADVFVEILSESSSSSASG